MILGVDVGGTFTDLVLVDEAGRLIVAKELNAEGSAIAAVRGAARATVGSVGEVGTIVYGTTAATNAVIERTGATTALITTKGFRDLLEFQHQNRSHLWDLYYKRPAPLVARDLRLEVEERISSDGAILQALDVEAEVDRLLPVLTAAGVRSVAVCLLNSYANGIHERHILERLKTLMPELYVSISSAVAPQFREYDRMSTTVLNAYLAPVVAGSLDEFRHHLDGAGFQAETLIMQSNGGVVPIDAAAERAASLCVSGPAGGVLASTSLARSHGIDAFICLDMGGTSTDVSLVADGQLALDSDGMVDGLPNLMPSFKIETVGSGGGSIAWIDDGGMLQVGPASAGASPGSACYGNGGVDPTVTDAWCALGVIGSGGFGDGAIQLDREAARAAAQQLARDLGTTVEEAYWQAVRVATSTMTRAVHLVSTTRGYDPRDFALIAYGGAGGLHAALVADELDITTIVVPPSPGVFSAYGMLCADLKRDHVRTSRRVLSAMSEAELDEIFAPLEVAARSEFGELTAAGEEVMLSRTLEMRYQNQAYEIQVPSPPRSGIADLAHDFHERHHHQYGFSEPEGVVEAINYRVQSSVARPTPLLSDPTSGGDETVGEVYLGSQMQCRFVSRGSISADETVDGPAVISEATATTLVPVGWSARRDVAGLFWLRRSASERA